MFDRVLSDLTRTTNIVESWHREMNERVGVAHPNIAHLVKIFKQEEEKTYLGLNQDFQGNLNTSRVMISK